MRIRAAASASLLALALVAGCSDDDDPAVDASDASSDDVEAESTDDEATVDDDERDDLADSDADAQAAIDAAQLEAEDLGEGWTLTGTTPPSDSDDDEPNPLDDCMESDLDDQFDEATIAETDERSFSREGDGVVPTEVTASNVALSDESLFDEMHDLLRSDDFGTCMGTAFEDLLAESAAGAEVTLGDIEVTEDVVDPDAADDVSSTSIDIPVTVSSQGFTLEAEVTMAFLNVGELGGSILVFGAADDLRAESIAEWGNLVVERLAGA